MKKKIMAMVFAAMMMVASFTATSSGQGDCQLANIYCMNSYQELVLHNNTTMVCGNSLQEVNEQFAIWTDLICGENYWLVR